MTWLSKDEIKRNLCLLLILGLVAFFSCDNASQQKEQPVLASKVEQSITIEGKKPIPINYRFESLGLHLYHSINSDTTKMDWSWDVMTSGIASPDTIGVGHYFNINQATFTYNGGPILPTLYAKTIQNKIIEFNASYGFMLPNHEKESIALLMDSLSVFDLLRDTAVRAKIIENGQYLHCTESFEEALELTLATEKQDYDLMSYTIKVTK